MGVYYRADRGAWVIRYTDAQGRTIRQLTPYRKQTDTDKAKAIETRTMNASGKRG